MCNTWWCLFVYPDIHIIPDIPEIPDIHAIPEVPNIPDIPIYYHAKFQVSSSKNGQVIAIFIKCAKFVTKKKKDISPL